MSNIKCNHTYDETGHCFECDKPKPVTQNERKQQERERKRAAGLVRIELWLTPDQAKTVRECAEGLKQADIFNAGKLKQRSL